jgi:SAM-dependent methyltransferase
MFSETARYYDRIYHRLDYDESTRHLREIIEPRTQGRRLLDVACGTGQHLVRFRDAGYEVEGLDLDPDMLAVARERFDGPLHEADMCDFHLGRQFDVITNSFSSIGYARSVENLHRALSCVAEHLAPGGVALVEPWLRKEKYTVGHIHMTTVDDADLKIARVNRGDVEGECSVIDFHYAIVTPEKGARFARERHVLAMFGIEDFAAAAKAAGLEHEHFENEHFQRGLHVFTK